MSNSGSLNDTILFMETSTASAMPLEGIINMATLALAHHAAYNTAANAAADYWEKVA